MFAETTPRGRHLRKLRERPTMAAKNTQHCGWPRTPQGRAGVWITRSRRHTVFGSHALALLALLGTCFATANGQNVAERHVAQTPRAFAATLNEAVRAHPVAFLDRIGWGANSAQLAELHRLGAIRFLDAQLDPRARAALPSPLGRSLSRLPVNAPLENWVPELIAEERSTLRARGRISAESHAAQAANNRLKILRQHANLLVRQAMQEQLLRAIYAQNQLHQRLIWFWMNHFNVFRGGNIGPMMGDYVRHVIAPHVLGHFRTLLQATMFSPQMLLYLNNAQNHRGHINENYAREVMELHSVGLGAHYTQTDVTDLAHVLTGLGVDLLGRPVHVRPALRAWVWQHGLVVFNPARHDPQPERVLGHTFAGQGIGEIEQVITVLANDPATARHISYELAQYFVADQPSAALVSAMVRTWEHTHGNIAAVMRTLFMSPQFAASLSQPQFKDPMRYLLSAVRASYSGRIVTNPQPLIGMLYRLGEPLYGRQTPDGYPLAADAWSSPGQLTTRFAVAQQLAAGAPALFLRSEWMHRVSYPLASRAWMIRPAQPPDLEHSAVFEAAEATLSQATLSTLAQTTDRRRWNALWLSSPEFMTE